MKSTSIKRNAVLNIIRTSSNILFPLITFPYVSRILSVEGLGKVNYSISIISYFSLIAALGITPFAVREGAKLRNDRKKLQEFIDKIISLNLLTTLISYILLFLLISLSSKVRPYTVLLVIQSLTIIFNTIGVEWVNNIFEDYNSITIRSVIIQCVSLLLMVNLIKNQNDYVAYSVINTLIVVFNGGINWIYCRKYFKFHFLIDRSTLKYLTKSIIFFANNLAVQIYVNSDLTMLGYMTNDYYTGLYSAVVKIYSFTKQLFYSIYFITIPRLSIYISMDKINDYKDLLNKILALLVLLMVPSSIGIISLSNEVITLFCGIKYIAGVTSLQILSLTIIIAIIGGVFTSCINIPMGQEKTNLIATSIAAVINIILNIYLIPRYADIGASFTTLVAELTVVIVCFWIQKRIYMNIISFKYQLINLGESFFASFSIPVIYFFIKKTFENQIFIVLLTIIFSVITYFILCFIMKNKLVISFVNEIIHKVKANI